MKQKWKVIFSLVGLLVAIGAIAQSPSNPSSEEIIRALQPQAKTRSLGFGGNTRNLAPMVDLTINFDYDSATIRDEVRGALQNLAAALNDARLSGLKFRVEGHTDAKGTAAYNDALSDRRAQSVVGFLVAEGVGADRLESVGKGFHELLDPKNPQAPQNRRVRVLTLQ